MENAAKALLIAGGIFLALIVISLFVIMNRNLNKIGNAQMLEQQARELAAWNAEWEAYNKGFLYGAEVVTVLNKANNEEDVSVTVETYIEDSDGNRTYYVYNNEDFSNNLDGSKTKIFKCTEVKYSNGRVTEILFEQN